MNIRKQIVQAHQKLYHTISMVPIQDRFQLTTSAFSERVIDNKLIPQALKSTIINTYKFFFLGQIRQCFLQLVNAQPILLRKVFLQLLLDFTRIIDERYTGTELLTNRVMNPGDNHIIASPPQLHQRVGVISGFGQGAVDKSKLIFSS